MVQVYNISIVHIFGEIAGYVGLYRECQVGSGQILRSAAASV